MSVGFDVGGRAFVLSGVGVPAPCVAASGSGSGVGGVRVCVPCAVRVFGDSWCFLVLRRWARAAGVDGVKVDALLGSAPGSDSGPVASGSVVPVSPGAGVAASEFGSESEPVGSVSSLASLSGSTPVSGVSGGPVPASGAVSVAECGGVRACVPCAVRVFGDGWCFLVLLVWMGREFLGCFLLLLIACLGLVRCLMAPCPCLVLCP